MKPLSHSMQHEQRPLYIVWLWNWNKIYENLGSLSGRVMGRCNVARRTAGAKFEVVRQIAWAVVPNGNEIKIHWIDFQFFYIAQTAFERCERTKRRWQKRNCVHNVHLKRTRAMKQTNKQNPSCTNLLLLRMIHLRSHRPAKRKKKNTGVYPLHSHHRDQEQSSPSSNWVLIGSTVWRNWQVISSWDQSSLNL